eukprot:scaffold4413_cov91-Cylindrotheca_fusiformis.AAC.3
MQEGEFALLLLSNDCHLSIFCTFVRSQQQDDEAAQELIMIFGDPCKHIRTFETDRHDPCCGILLRRRFPEDDCCCFFWSSFFCLTALASIFP